MDSLKKWIKENPWKAFIFALIFGAMFLAAPVALVVAAVRKKVGAPKQTAPTGTTANATAAEAQGVKT